jgi:hypothetical protein
MASIMGSHTGTIQGFEAKVWATVVTLFNNWDASDIFPASSGSEINS